MKHYFYLAAAIIGLLMAASCQKENFGDFEGNYAEVSFTTEIPSGVATRSIADGNTVNTLYYEVYEVTTEDETEVLGDTPVFDAKARISGETTISVRLKKGKKYTAIFWAQYEPEAMLQDGEPLSSPYDVEDLKSIKVSYSNALANDEGRDAFYAVITKEISTTYSYNVTLKRPFAQVNVATSDYEASGDEVYNMESSLTISNVADTFNPLTNKATVSSGVELEAQFNRTNIPDEFLKVGEDNTTYKYLAMAYVLVPSAAETSISTISSQIWLNGVNEPISVSYEGATLKQNHRTNLIGNILSGYTNFHIEIDNKFDNDNTYAVSTYNELSSLITDNTTTYKNITLTDNITINNTISIPGDNIIILNLNGKTLENNVNNGRAFEITSNNVTLMVNAEGSEVNFGNGTTGFIQLKENASNASVTINGGTFTGTSANGTLIRFRNNVNNNIVTLNNVNYTDNASLNTKETTNSTQNAFVVFAENEESMGTANKLIVKGGTFNTPGGFVVPFNSEFDGAIITAKGTGLELKSIVSQKQSETSYKLTSSGSAIHKVRNCTVTLADGATIEQAPGACIAASYSGNVTIENCILNAPKSGTYALATWSSGGTINVTSSNINGAFYVAGHEDNTGVVTIDAGSNINRGANQDTIGKFGTLTDNTQQYE